jgi:hypothetical protein
MDRGNETDPRREGSWSILPGLPPRRIDRPLGATNLISPWSREGFPGLESPRASPVPGRSFPCHGSQRLDPMAGRLGTFRQATASLSRSPSPRQRPFWAHTAQDGTSPDTRAMCGGPKLGSALIDTGR